MDMNKYDGIFNNGHTPMLIIESESGEIRDANQAACAYYGYTREELLELRITDINILSQQEVFKEMELARNENRKYFRFRHRLSDGEIKEVEVYSGPVSLNDELLLFSIIHDVQERKEMEERIRVQESYFKSLYENSPEAIVMLDNEYRVISINGSFEKMFGYKLEEVRHENITKIICAPESHDESAYFKDSINRGEFVRKEILRRNKEGKPIHVSFLGYPIMDGSKQIGVFGIYSDLSKAKKEKREHEKKVQMYVNILRNTIDSIPQIISVFRPDFSVALLNETGCRYFNVPMEKTEGMDWNELVKRRFVDGDRYAARVIETQKPYSAEKQLAETKQYFEWRCDPILDEDGQLMLIVERIIDITTEKRHEEELTNAKKKAEEASRLKTQFITNITHEIRTPMNGIIGIIDIMEDMKLNSRQKEYFHMLRYSADRLSSLINSVLDISKIEAGKLELKKESFCITNLLDEAVKYFRIQAEKKELDLSANIDPRLPDFVFGDPERLNQVLFNLLSNALKFTESGYISLDVKLLANNNSTANIRFSVNDTGIGIPKEKIRYVFYDFVQLDSSGNRKYSGTGLGLPISKRLVGLMGSKITVRSEYGKGSTFSFAVRFPVVKDQEQTAVGAEDDAEETSREMLMGLEVLVVEDEKINQRVLVGLLEKGGCNLAVAGNGTEALEAMDKRSFDMVLLDIYMPDMDGYEVAQIIRRKEKAAGGHVPIIAITAAVLKEDREKYKKVGIDYCVAKPFEKKQLYAAIRHVLGGEVREDRFGLAALLDRLEGNEELLGEIIEAVISGRYEEELFSGIERYMRDRDADRLYKHIHKYKGSISHFRAENIDKLLGEIKKCCRSGDLPAIENMLPRLHKEYEELKEYLALYLGRPE